MIDDLASALDMETEKLLWMRLKALSVTLLVATHRREALKLAHHIVVLKDGYVEAAGTLDTLLESCEELQKLWVMDRV